jgi:glucan biosynthesis protein C
MLDAMILGPVCSVAIQVLMYLYPQLRGGPYFCGMLNPTELLVYLPFFVFGLRLYRDQQGLYNFSRFNAMTVWTFVMILALYLVHENSPGHPVDQALDIYRDGMVQWFACHICFSLFRSFLDAPSMVFKYLADASYTVYLFHHVAVVAFARQMMAIEVTALVKFLIVMFSTLGITLLTHELLIRRVGLLGLMFNGQRHSGVSPRKPVHRAIEPSVAG